MPEPDILSRNGAGPTAASEWRKPREEGYLITLFSGNKARLRPVSIAALMAQGSIPDILSAVAAQTVWAGPESFLPDDLDDLLSIQDSQERKAKVAAWFEQIGEGAPKLLLMQDIVVRAAFLEPAIVPAGHKGPLPDGAITIEDVEDVDKAQVYQICTRGAAALKSFRDRQIRDAQTVPDGQNDGDAPESVDADHGPVDGAATGQRGGSGGRGAGKRSAGDGEGGAGGSTGVGEQVHDVAVA